jgi:hypothetical protein
LYSNVYCSKYSPFVTKFESGVKYTIIASNLYANSLNINKVASLAKEFTNFYLTDENGNYYNAVIDTVANTLKFKVSANTNLSKMNYYYSTVYNEFTTVSVNDSIIGNSGLLNFSNLSTIKLTDALSVSTLYSISFAKILGADCNSAITITNDTTAGNGFYTQYFSCTPSKTGYIGLFSPETDLNINVSTGDCGSLTYLTGGWCDNSSPLIMKAELGVKYTLQANNLYDNNLVISEISDFSKEFRSFSVSDGNDNYFSAVIDTATNTLVFNVSTDLDLSKLNYSFNCTSGNWVTVSANNSIIDNYGTLNFNNLSSLVITDKNAKTATYSLKFVRISGLTCSSATPVTEGKFVGNGAYNQFFSFTPAQTEYVNIYPVDNYTYVSVRAGDCDNNIKVVEGSCYSSYPLSFKAKAGVNYIISVNSLEEGSMVINKIANISKEFTYFNLTDADGYNYNADIDTVANTLTFNVAPDCDITSLTYNYNRMFSNYTTVIYGDAVVPENGWLDFSKLTSLIITDITGASATYSVQFKQVQGLSCGSAVNIAEGKTPCNGQYRQFFTFSPTKTGFVSISPLNGEANMDVLLGECGAFYSVINQYVSSYSPLLIKVKAGTTYTFKSQGLFNDTLNVVRITSLPKEFTYFQITDAEGNEYSADIDTVANKLTFTVATNCNLEGVLCNFNTTSRRFTEVKANDVSFVNSGVYDLSKISSLVITDVNAEKATYTLVFNKLKGLSCSDAVVAVKGSNAGNGAYRQYFTFTPTKSEFLGFYPDKDYSDINIYKGTCGELSLLVNDWAESTYPLVFKAEAGVNYTIAVSELYDNKLNIETQNSIPKEFAYFNIYGDGNYYSADIDTVANTLTFYVDSDCDLSSMSYNFKLRSGLYSFASANSVAIESSGILNFNSVQSLVITDILSAKATYTLIFKKVASTDVVKFALEGQLSSTINSANKTISVIMPYKSDVSNLVAIFSVLNGTSVKVGSILQHSGVTANDYTKAVVYTVVAQDGITTQNWTVNVSIGKNTETLITAFNIEGQSVPSQIDTTAKVINVVMPYGTDVKALKATFTLSDGATAKVGSVLQVSGTTANDYTTKVTFVVVAQDGITTQSWTVNVSFAKNTDASIKTFELAGQSGSASINVETKTINIVMPSGSDVKSLVATFTLSDGATAKIGSVQQISGTTANDYTNEVSFIVVAEDGVTTQTWKVVVKISTAIENTLSASVISVYPNPSSGVFNIKFNESINDNVKLSVFNAAGSMVFAKTVNNEKLISVDLAEQPNGIYYLNVSNGDDTVTIKLIINK